MVMSGDQNAGQKYNKKTDHSSYEKVEGFKYVGTTILNQNFIHEEIKKKIEVRECFLSFSAESFVFQFVIQKYKEQNIQNYNFVCFVWV